MHKNRLKELRNEKKLSIRDLSEIIHVNRNAIQRLETNLQSLTDEYIQIFCDFYKVSSDYLLGLSNVRNNNDIEKLHDPLYITIYDKLNELDPDSQEDILSMISKMKEIIQKK